MPSTQPSRSAAGDACVAIVQSLAALALAAALTACGGSDAGDSAGSQAPPAPPSTATSYMVSASVSGLQGSGLVLRMNADLVPVASDGRISFPSVLASG